jgi:hypothetical protein
MKIIVKSVLIITFIIVGMILIICAVGFFPLSHPYINKRAEQFFKYAGVDSCKTGMVTVIPYKGDIRLTDFVLRQKIDEKWQLTIELQDVSAVFVLSHLLKKYKTCFQLLKNKMRSSVFIREFFQGVGSGSGKKIEYFSSLYKEMNGVDTVLLSCVKSLRCSRIGLYADSINQTVFSINSLSAVVTKPVRDTIGIICKAKMDSVKHREFVAEGVEVALTMYGPILHVSTLTARVCDGFVQSTGSIDMPHDAINTWKVDYRGGNLEKLYALKQHHEGSLTGTCDLTMQVKPGPIEVDKLQGTVKVSMDTVRADELPVMKRVALLTSIMGFEHMRFSTIDGDFKIDKKRISTNNLSGTGYPLTLQAKGWVQPDTGSFNFNVKAIVAASYKDSLIPIIWNTLMPQPDGSRCFSLTIFGTEQSPNVSLEKDLAKRAINSIFESLGDKLLQFLR